MRVMRMFLVWAKETGRISKLPLPKDTPMGHSAKKDQQDDTGKKRKSAQAAARS